MSLTVYTNQNGRLKQHLAYATARARNSGEERDEGTVVQPAKVLKVGGTEDANGSLLIC